MMTRTLILALSLTIAATPAIASESEHKTAAIRIDDLNLTRATERERLDVRVKARTMVSFRPRLPRWRLATWAGAPSPRWPLQFLATQPLPIFRRNPDHPERADKIFPFRGILMSMESHVPWMEMLTRRQ
jgi:hypothetical protein